METADYDNFVTQGVQGNFEDESDNSHQSCNLINMSKLLMLVSFLFK